MKKTTVAIVSDVEIEITRWFDAPRALIFEAMTKPEHVRQWYGCETMAMVTCEMDFRVGGKWRHALRMPDGSEHAFFGEYRAIDAPGLIVSTENYEPIGPGHEMLATVTLEEKDGRTLFKNRIRYPSKADRDGHLASGMENGLDGTFDRLERVGLTLQ